MKMKIDRIRMIIQLFFLFKKSQLPFNNAQICQINYQNILTLMNKSNSPKMIHQRCVSFLPLQKIIKLRTITHHPSQNKTNHQSPPLQKSQQCLAKLPHSPSSYQKLYPYIDFYQRKLHNILVSSNKSPHSPRLKRPTKVNPKLTTLQQQKQDLKYLPTFVKKRSIKNDQQAINGISKVQIQDFDIILKLGEGKFGKVFLVKEKITGFILALKIVQKKIIRDSGLINQFIRELKIQSFIQHPNIIQIYAICTDQYYFYTLMQFAPHGQLYSLISQNISITQQTTSYVLRHLLNAVCYLHSLRIIHRDIKPQNIVLIYGTLKICDFGWAIYRAGKDQLRETFCGTPLYLSPQVLTGCRYDEKVDLWAIGILGFQLLTKESPFQIQSRQQLDKIIYSCIIFPSDRHISQCYQEFVQAILTKNPRQRMSCLQLMKMQFITKYQDLQICESLCKQ